MKFWVLILACFVSLIGIGSVSAQCPGGVCNVGFRPVRVVQRVREVRVERSAPASTRWRLFDGDGRPFRKAS